MSEGFLHRHVIGDRLAFAFASIGALVAREHPISSVRPPRRADLWVEWEGFRLLCEVEMTPRRVPGDVIKGVASMTDGLLIVGPNTRVVVLLRRAVKRARPLVPGHQPQILVLTLGAALKLIENPSQLLSWLSTARSRDCKTATRSAFSAFDNSQPRSRSSP